MGTGWQSPWNSRIRPSIAFPPPFFFLLLLALPLATVLLLTSPILPLLFADLRPWSLPFLRHGLWLSSLFPVCRTSLLRRLGLRL